MPPFTSADASPRMSMPFGPPPSPLRQRRRKRPHIGLDDETGRLRNVGGDRAKAGGDGKRRGGGDARAGEKRDGRGKWEINEQERNQRGWGRRSRKKNGESHDGIRGRDERAMCRARNPRARAHSHTGLAKGALAPWHQRNPHWHLPHAHPTKATNSPTSPAC